MLHVVSFGVPQLWLRRNGNIIEVKNSNLIELREEAVPKRFNIDRTAQINLPKTAMGMNINLEISWNPCRIQSGDIFFLATDGVILDTALKSLLTSIPERIGQTSHLQLLVEKAFDHSNSIGNLDNQTLLLIEY
jgi:serine/threonine protein phosphatase PrpC